MNTLHVELLMHGDARRAPVNVEVIDRDLAVVAQSWIDGQQPHSFTLPPGQYAVRAALPSGRSFEKAVTLDHATANETVKIPVYEASPHEAHEWAYLSRDLQSVGSGLLSEDLFKGLWARLWTRYPDSEWRVEPLETPRELADKEDGVSFSLDTKRNEQTMLQLGGDNIPWKLAVLPPEKETKILIRPNIGPTDRVHPLDVTVSSTDWELESLLSLLTRGRTGQAADLMDKRGLAATAEQRLRGKMADPYGALIGGYALLHLQALDQMHDWANNLANWFDAIPDGPVIHGWKQFELARNDDDEARRQALICDARESFLEAQRRGVPVISEGLRRLRDGLLMFRSNDRNDEEVKAALARVGEYTAVTDFTSSTTIFTGAHPTEPTPEPPIGCPTDEEYFSYVYDIPLADVFESGELLGGTLTAEGNIKLGGQTYSSLGTLQAAMRKNFDDPMIDWNNTPSDAQLNSDIGRNLRFRPLKAYGPTN